MAFKPSGRSADPSSVLQKKEGRVVCGGVCAREKDQWECKMQSQVPKLFAPRQNSLFYILRNPLGNKWFQAELCLYSK